MLQCNIFLLFIICWAGTASTTMCLVYCHTRPGLQGTKNAEKVGEEVIYRQFLRGEKKKEKSLNSCKQEQTLQLWPRLYVPREHVPKGSILPEENINQKRKKHPPTSFTACRVTFVSSAWATN